MRADKAPARDAQLAETPLAKKGSELFDKIWMRHPTYDR